jgi:hypothetical protein
MKNCFLYQKSKSFQLMTTWIASFCNIWGSTTKRNRWNNFQVDPNWKYKTLLQRIKDVNVLSLQVWCFMTSWLAPGTVRSYDTRQASASRSAVLLGRVAILRAIFNYREVSRCLKTFWCARPNCVLCFVDCCTVFMDCWLFFFTSPKRLVLFSLLCWNNFQVLFISLFA